MKRYGVVVVGGGPAGALAAETAAKAGARVLVVERSPNRPARCAGLVGPRTLDVLDLPPRLILRTIRSVRLHAPNGTAVEFDAPEPRGYVLDRAGLDRWLLARAEEAGAAVGHGVAALGLERDVLHTGAGSVRFDTLVGADGAMSSVRRWAGLPPPQEILAGPQAMVAASLRDDQVEIHLGANIAPGFFAWVVPRTEETALVGLLTTDMAGASGLLDRFLPIGSRAPLCWPGSRAWCRSDLLHAVLPGG